VPVDEVWAIVVAGGEGRRFGGPKQFSRVGGRLVVEWSLEAASSVAEGVVLVVPQDVLADGSLHGGCTEVVAGGATRSASVRAGLARVPRSAEIVVVHDAARPLASTGLFKSVVEAVRGGAEAVIPAVPVTDTIKRVADRRVAETLERADLVTVQTPQAFRAELLRRAHATELDASDDAALVESLGVPVTVVAGEHRNRKITSIEDVSLIDAWLTESDR
jgi:2-C-methyl-D-erythritol 4-phosphate cytidylyltransferase